MNANINRGDIFYITEDPSKSATGAEIWADRPGLVISNDALNKTSNCVEVVYLTTSPNKRPAPTHIAVKSGNKMAMAMCEQIHTVDKARLTDFIGSITEDEMMDIEGGILFSLQINRGRNPQGIFKKYQKMLEKYPELKEAYDIP
jgi:mRNA-degrading endonuclease toxin of MazEF toxin-antitoxin module